MNKEELLEDKSIFDDKDIIEKLNENKELRDWFLVELNVSLQRAESVTAGYENKKEMRCYKNAVTSLQIENQELKKQLEEKQNPLKGIFAQVNDDMLLRNCGAMQSEIDEYKNQQKEFIEYLEKYKDGASGSLDSYDTGISDCLDDVISKYKEIIGGKDER